MTRDNARTVVTPSVRDAHWAAPPRQVIRFLGFESSQYRTPSTPATGPGGWTSHRLGGGGARAVFPFAVGLVEQLLAQADRLRRHLDQFVVLDIGQGLFQRHADRRGGTDRVVPRGGADIGELLAPEHVDDQVVVAG